MVEQLARVTTLTGPTEEVDSDEFTKQKAISKDLLVAQHKIWYLSPYTAARDAVQRQLCEQAGLFVTGGDMVVGMDLEYSGECILANPTVPSGDPPLYSHRSQIPVKEKKGTHLRLFCADPVHAQSYHCIQFVPISGPQQ